MITQVALRPGKLHLSVSNIASFFNDQIVKPTKYLTHCGLLCSSVMIKSLYMFYYQKHSDGNIIYAF